MAPRSPEDNQEIRDSRQGALLAAAARVFARHGVARAKISEIASEAGVSHGLVYHYFSSKDAIFTAIIDGIIERIDARLDAAEGSAYEQLVDGIRWRSEVAAGGSPDEEHRLLAQALMRGPVSREVQERLSRHMDGLFALTTDRVRRAQADGDLDRSLPPEEIASLLMATMRGLTIPSWGARTVPLPDVETLIQLLLPRPTRSRSR